MPASRATAESPPPKLKPVTAFEYRSAEGTARDALLVLFVAGSTYYGVTARDFVLTIFLAVYAYTLIWVPERVYASTAALVRGKPGEGYEWRWYAALAFRLGVPYAGQRLIELLCRDLTCSDDPRRLVTGCTYIDSSLFAACLGLRVTFFLVKEMLETNEEKLEGLREPSTLAQLDQAMTECAALREHNSAIECELAELRRHVKRNERVLQRYAAEQGEKIDSLREFERRMSPLSDMLREAEEEVASDTWGARLYGVVFGPAHAVAAILLDPVGSFLPFLRR